MKEYLKQLPYKLKKYKSNGFFLFSDILVQYICGIIMFAVMQYQFSDIANIFNIQHIRNIKIVHFYTTYKTFFIIFSTVKSYLSISSSSFTLSANSLLAPKLYTFMFLSE